MNKKEEQTLLCQILTEWCIEYTQDLFHLSEDPSYVFDRVERKGYKDQALAQIQKLGKRIQSKFDNTDNTITDIQIKIVDDLTLSIQENIDRLHQSMLNRKISPLTNDKERLARKQQRFEVALVELSERAKKNNVASQTIEKNPTVHSEKNSEWKEAIANWAHNTTQGTEGSTQRQVAEVLLEMIDELKKIQEGLQPVSTEQNPDSVPLPS